MNNILNMLGQVGQMGKSMGVNNPMIDKLSLLSEFNKFRKDMGNKDPSVMLTELMNSGKFTQEQYENAKRMALANKDLLK